MTKKHDADISQCHEHDQSTGKDLKLHSVRRGQILDWLVGETHQQRFIDDIFVELCEKLRGSGIPLTRASMHFQTHHPDRVGARVLWRDGRTNAEISTLARDAEVKTRSNSRPVIAIFKGAIEIRQRLELIDAADLSYSLFIELKREGITDYLAWPLRHTLGETHAVTFCTTRPGGFAQDHLKALKEFLPILSLVTEVRLKNIRIRSLLETYVGPHASEEILAGATSRGSGVTVGAAILIADLRDFTAISDRLPRDDVIELLNGFFETISQPIENRGGEILKFMGDGLLAIFPLSNPGAGLDLLKAVKEAQAAMTDLNKKAVQRKLPSLRYGVGVHVGDVMYGNIGSRRRLDFTAIGPAVNVASRLETLTKKVKRRVLLSGAFVEMANCRAELDALGLFKLRGLKSPVDVFALPDLPDSSTDAQGSTFQKAGAIS